MRRLLTIVGVLLLLGVPAWLVFKSHTPPVFAPNGIAELTTFDLNGDKQAVLIRGENKDAPILLFIHGGPGKPLMYASFWFQRALEKDFLVVQYDQRVAGKSYHRDFHTSTLSTSQLFSDAETLILKLQARFGKRKVFVVGHDYGSLIGVLLAQWRPDLVQAYIGTGQLADDARPLQEEFLRRTLGLASDVKIDGTNREDLLFQSGAMLHGWTSRMPLTLAGIFAPEYSLVDNMNLPKALWMYQRYFHHDIVREWDMRAHYRKFAVPVYFVMGAHDMVTPPALAQTYFDEIEAPKKRFIAFDGSAHFPFFEEPERFAQALREIKADALAPAP